MNKKSFFSYAHYIIKFIPISLGVLSSFLFLGQKSFNFDEAFSVAISGNLHDLLNRIWTTEANMWLYYALLHYWQIFGHTEFAIRSLSTIPAVLTIFVIYQLGKELFNRKVGFFASLLTAINMYFIFFAQEARSYSLLLLLTTLSSYFFTKYIKGSKKYGFFYVLAASLTCFPIF